MSIKISSFNSGGVSYIDLAEFELVQHENDGENFNPYNDSSLAMGYGYDLIQNSLLEIDDALNYINRDGLTAAQKALINDAKLKQSEVDSAVVAVDKDPQNSTKLTALNDAKIKLNTSIDKTVTNLGIALNGDDSATLLNYSLNKVTNKTPILSIKRSFI